MPEQMEGPTEGQKDGKILFHMTLTANAGGPKIISIVFPNSKYIFEHI